MKSVEPRPFGQRNEIPVPGLLRSHADTPRAAGRRTEIVGVVPSAQLRASQRRPEPALYLPMAQDWLPRMTLILGTREANEPMLTSVRRRLDVVPGGTSSGVVVTTLDAHLSRTALAPERIALGARGWQVIRQVLAEGMRLAGAGAVAGMLGSLLVARWLARITSAAGSPSPWAWLAAPSCWSERSRSQACSPRAAR